MIMSNITYVMAFYNFNNNKRHNFDHYKKHLRNTFRVMPNSQIIFFYQDKEIINLIRRRCKTNKLIPIKINYNDLPTREITKKYVNSLKKLDIKKINCKDETIEKGITHFKEILKCGEETYLKILTVWTSKLFLVEKAILKNPFKSNIFSWVDISLAKMNGRNKWNWVTNKYPEDKISFYPSNMTYYGSKLNLSAGFIRGEKNLMLLLIDLFKKRLETHSEDIYGHDEETLLNLISNDKPDLFYIIE